MGGGVAVWDVDADGDHHAHGDHHHDDGTHHICRHAPSHQPPSMTLVGKWSNGQLGYKRSKKSSRNDDAEPSFLNAKFVTPVVEHRKHDAVYGCEKTPCNLQNVDQSLMGHRATLDQH
jgi:hypothetical protein